MSKFDEVVKLLSGPVTSMDGTSYWIDESYKRYLAQEICRLFEDSEDTKYNLTDTDQHGKIIEITVDKDNRITSWSEVQEKDDKGLVKCNHANNCGSELCGHKKAHGPYSSDHILVRCQYHHARVRCVEV